MTNVSAQQPVFKRAVNLPVKFVRTRLPELHFTFNRADLNTEEVALFLRIARPLDSQPLRAQHRLGRPPSSPSPPSLLSPPYPSFQRGSAPSFSGRSSRSQDYFRPAGSRPSSPSSLLVPPAPLSLPFPFPTMRLSAFGGALSDPIRLMPEEKARYDTWLSTIDNPKRVRRALDSSSWVLGIFARSEDVPPFVHPAYEEICRSAEAPRAPLERLGRALSALGTLRPLSFSREGKRLVAFARVFSDESMVAVISDVAVHPSFRGLGLGRLLLQKLTHEIYYSGRIADIGIMTTSECVPFFESCGFAPDREGSVSMTFRPSADKVLQWDELKGGLQGQQGSRYLELDTLPAILKRAARTNPGKKKGTFGGRNVVQLPSSGGTAGGAAGRGSGSKGGRGKFNGLRSFWAPRSGWDA